MNTSSLQRRVGHVFGALALVAALVPAHADGERAGMRVPLLPAYKQECGSCHLAYPPGLLPASSWQRLMGDLPHHFGTDASLDAADACARSAAGCRPTPAARATPRRRRRTASRARRGSCASTAR